MAVPGLAGLSPHLVELVEHFLKAVALGQTGGGRGGRPRRGGKSIPTPQGAGFRDQSLTLLQLRLQRHSLVIADDPDLGEPPPKGFGCFHVSGEGTGVAGKPGRRGWSWQRSPMHGCGFIHGCDQILAQCGAEGDLESRVDIHGINHGRPKIPIADNKEFRESFLFGLQAGCQIVGCPVRLPVQQFLGSGDGSALFGFGKCLFRGFKPPGDGFRVTACVIQGTKIIRFSLCPGAILSQVLPTPDQTFTSLTQALGPGAEGSSSGSRSRPATGFAR